MMEEQKLFYELKPMETASSNITKQNKAVTYSDNLEIKKMAGLRNGQEYLL